MCHTNWLSQFDANSSCVLFGAPTSLSFTNWWIFHGIKKDLHTATAFTYCVENALALARGSKMLYLLRHLFCFYFFIEHVKSADLDSGQMEFMWYPFNPSDQFHVNIHPQFGHFLRINWTSEYRWAKFQIKCVRMQSKHVHGIPKIRHWWDFWTCMSNAIFFSGQKFTIQFDCMQSCEFPCGNRVLAKCPKFWIAWNCVKCLAVDFKSDGKHERNEKEKKKKTLEYWCRLDALWLLLRIFASPLANGKRKAEPFVKTYESSGTHKMAVFQLKWISICIRRFLTFMNWGRMNFLSKQTERMACGSNCKGTKTEFR